MRETEIMDDGEENDEGEKEEDEEEENGNNHRSHHHHHEEDGGGRRVRRGESEEQETMLSSSGGVGSSTNRQQQQDNSNISSWKYNGLEDGLGPNYFDEEAIITKFDLIFTQRPLIQRMKPIIRTLQVLSLYPLPMDSLQSFNRCRTFNKTLLLWALLTISTSVNAFCLFINYYITVKFNAAHGFWSEKTLVTVVTGIKPLINLGHLIIFACVSLRHRKLLRQLMMVENSFLTTFSHTLKMTWLTTWFFIVLVATFLLTLTLRVFEYWLLSERPGEDFLNDISFLLVPLLSVWNILPLLYFGVLCQMLRKCFQKLEETMADDLNLTKHSLRFYYRQYLKLTQLLSSMGHVFNPFIFFTIAWTVLTLCLTIYFATQVTSFIKPVTPTQPMSKEFYIFVFNMLYCIFQVVLAVVFLGAMCIIGTMTNETVVSAVITYGLLLLKLKGGEESPGGGVPGGGSVGPGGPGGGGHGGHRGMGGGGRGGSGGQLGGDGLMNLPNPNFIQDLVTYLGNPNITCLPSELIFSILLGSGPAAAAAGGAAHQPHHSPLVQPPPHHIPTSSSIGPGTTAAVGSINPTSSMISAATTAGGPMIIGLPSQFSTLPLEYQENDQGWPTSSVTLPPDVFDYYNGNTNPPPKLPSNPNYGSRRKPLNNDNNIKNGPSFKQLSGGGNVDYDGGTGIPIIPPNTAADYYGSFNELWANLSSFVNSVDYFTTNTNNGTSNLTFSPIKR